MVTRYLIYYLVKQYPKWSNINLSLFGLVTAKIKERFSTVHLTRIFFCHFFPFLIFHRV